MHNKTLNLLICLLLSDLQADQWVYLSSCVVDTELKMSPGWMVSLHMNTDGRETSRPGISHPVGFLLQPKTGEVNDMKSRAT